MHLPIDTAPGNAHTAKDVVSARRLVIRSENLRQILARIGTRWPLGGVDEEGDQESGNTRFWVRSSARATRIVFAISNQVLNETSLTRSEIHAYLDQVCVEEDFLEAQGACVG